MELSKKSELTVGSASYVVNTELAGEASDSIRTQVFDSGGSVTFESSQDISTLKPIFQNSQQVFSRLEAQHQNVIEELKAQPTDASASTPRATAASTAPSTAPSAQASTPTSTPASASEESSSPDHEADALEHAVSLLGAGNFEKATSALRAVLDTYPNCSEARELLEVAYKASEGTRLPIDLEQALRIGTEAFAAGRQRDAIEAWKQCLIEEPSNRLLQLLVMLATTWSQERRQHYANEALAAGSASLSAGRPGEAQALLLIAQNAETAQDSVSPMEAPTSPPPAPEPELDLMSTLPPELPVDPAPPAPMPPPAPAPIHDIGAKLESLVPDVSEMETVGSESSAVAPAIEAPPDWDSPTIAAPRPSFDNATTVPEPVAPVEVEPPPPAITSMAPPTIEVIDENSLPMPIPREEEISTPPTQEAEAPSAEATMPTRAPVTGRRPTGRAKTRSVPWPWIGGGIAAVVVIGLVVVWLGSGGSSVPQERLEQAAGYAGSGQYDQALASYDALLQEFGDHVDIYRGRGRAKVAAGNTDGGLSDLRRARDLDASAASISEEIGDVYYSSGNYPDAIDSYIKAFANGQGSAEARYRLASSYVQRDNGDAALEHLQAAISADPRHGEAQFLYGDLLNERGRFEEAEKALRAAKPHVEAGSDYLAEMSFALLGQDKLDEAEEVAHNYIHNYPSDARAHSVLGEVYLNRRQYEQARAQLIQALRTDRNEPRAQIALGRTWLAIGKTRGDEGDLAKARQVLTSATGVHEGQRLLALGQISLAEGDLATAERLLRQSLEQGAAALSVHLSLAESKALGDDLVGAAEEMQRASGLAPEDPGISLSLAIAYSQLEEADRAAEQFLKSIQGVGLLSPPGPDAGPVMLPAPYIPLPERFDVNRAIREAFTGVLEQRADDPSATELQTLAESTTFVLGTG